MKRFAEFRPGTNIVHYIHETDEKPIFHPSIVIMDVTGIEDIQEGYLYDEETFSFREPVLEPAQPTPPDPYQEMQSQILLNTEMLLVYKELGI